MIIEGKQYNKAIEIKDIKKIILPENLIFFTFVIKDPKIIPLNKLMIETDSPYLAPVPNRGKKNEPSFIKYTLAKLSELKSIKFEDLDQITTNNFEKLFF